LGTTETSGNSTRSPEFYIWDGITPWINTGWKAAGWVVA